jgi:hypothetical protein
MTCRCTPGRGGDTDLASHSGRPQAIAAQSHDSLRKTEPSPSWTTLELISVRLDSRIGCPGPRERTVEAPNLISRAVRVEIGRIPTGRPSAWRKVLTRPRSGGILHVSHMLYSPFKRAWI